MCCGIFVNIKDILPVLPIVKVVGGCGENLTATDKMLDIDKKYLENEKMKTKYEAVNGVLDNLKKGKGYFGFYPHSDKNSHL